MYDVVGILKEHPKSLHLRDISWHGPTETVVQIWRCSNSLQHDARDTNVIRNLDYKTAKEGPKYERFS